MNNIRKITLIFAIISIVCSAWLVPHPAFAKSEKYDLRLLAEKNSLEKQGRNYEYQSEFDRAAQKYQEAVELDNRIYGSKNGRALAFLAEVFQKQNRYEDALELVLGLVVAHPKQENYLDWKSELDALIKYKNTGSQEPVSEYLKGYSKKYEAKLPPNTYTFGSIFYVNRILMLYDTIGDYDAGITFIDEVLAYFRTGKAGDPNPGRVDAEYIKIREAFELDKKEGKKGSMKEGKPGRATLALIQSDYFPW